MRAEAPGVPTPIACLAHSCGPGGRHPVLRGAQASGPRPFFTHMGPLTMSLFRSLKSHQPWLGLRSSVFPRRKRKSNRLCSCVHIPAIICTHTHHTDHTSPLHAQIHLCTHTGRSTHTCSHRHTQNTYSHRHAYAHTHTHPYSYVKMHLQSIHKPYPKHTRTSHTLIWINRNAQTCVYAKSTNMHKQMHIHTHPIVIHFHG